MRTFTFQHLLTKKEIVIKALNLYAAFELLRSLGHDPKDYELVSIWDGKEEYIK